MKQFGLIGFPLSHSFSKKYFEEKFQRENVSRCAYDLFELKTIEEFPAFIEQSKNLVGVNVTIPYKESVMNYLDEISEEAKEVGAVNCIRIENRKLKGYNTDVLGFEISLQSYLRDAKVKAYILGSGGSSKAVEFVLKKLKIDFVKVSRQLKANCVLYSDISESLSSGKRLAPVLFINTTPLGMFPDINSSPDIPYHLITERDFLFDLVYNPTETEFLKRGRVQGAKTKNGFEMLQLQAEKSWEIWNS